MDWYLVHTRRGCEQATAYRLEHSLQLEVYIAEITQYCRGALAAGAAVPRLPVSVGAGRADCRRTHRPHARLRPAGAPPRRPSHQPGGTGGPARCRGGASPPAPGRHRCPTPRRAAGPQPPSRITRPRHRSGAGPASNWRVPSPASLQRPPGSSCSCRSPAPMIQRKPAMKQDPPAPTVKRPRRTRGHGRRIHYG